jgi:cytoskeleton protein RodZ
MNAADNGEDPAAIEAARTGSNEPAGSLTPGELLRRERERRGLSQLHIAEELHLDVRMVDALEANRFEELGVPVYARGHLRQYAALLGLSPQLIIERYEALNGTPEIPAPIPASVAVTAATRERSSMAGPLWTGVALIAALLGWWIWSTVSTPGDPIQGDPMRAAQNEQVAAEAASTSRPSTPISISAAEGLEPAATQAAPAATPPPEDSSGTAGLNAPAAEPVQLRLEFSDPSWTEIFDATNKRLMFGVGESGDVSTVTGIPPLRITLGNASAVAMQVNGQPVVVPRRAGRDITRFQIGPGGVVQMTSEVPVE